MKRSDGRTFGADHDDEHPSGLFRYVVPLAEKQRDEPVPRLIVIPEERKLVADHGLNLAREIVARLLPSA